MKKAGYLILLLFSFASAEADHITGGEMYYQHAGNSNGNHHYRCTLKLFMRCNSGREFSNPTIISIFNRGTGQRFTDLNVPLTRMETLQLTDAGPCITNPPAVCYVVGYYEFDVLVPPSSAGYVMASQVNYRIAGINNLASNYGLIGALYTAEIPGDAEISSGPVNSSAVFTGSDLVVVCAGNAFSYSFAASDDDGDQLRYHFGVAFQSTGGGGNGFGGSPPPTGPPPFPPVPYGTPDYDGANPLGNNVQIDPQSGLITGIAPPEGVYVVTVYAEEVRNGKVIATQRKDLQINITNCSIAGASLLPEYQLCGSSTAFSVSNLSNSPLIQTQGWQLQSASGAMISSGQGNTFRYNFSDTGIFYLKLVINQHQQCADSSVSRVRVYPGMKADFGTRGLCVLNQTQFTDQSFTRYGQIVSWLWDFGDPSSTADSARTPNAQYQYSGTGNKKVRLMIANDKGCRDTALTTLSIIDKPPISLLFRDSLICLRDSLQLQASGTGSFTWSPQSTLQLANSSSPWAHPSQTTTYFVELNEGGCINRDSLRVRVVDHVTLFPMPDTTVCTGDSLRLRLASDGLQFSWTPATSVDDPQIRQPLAHAEADTRFFVTARIGSCQAGTGIQVHTVPYPLVQAGADTTICFEGIARLDGISDGFRYEWSPRERIEQPASLHTIAHPSVTTKYILTAFGNAGCPKPSADSMLVTVLPGIIPDAGRDTNVVVGQPLQFHATGGVRYHWTPATGLSNADVADPVGMWPDPQRGLEYRVTVFNELGCSETASVRVKVFQSGPEVFVPNAFTPDNDGHNDVFRPIAAGISEIRAFQVYNRWGQLVYSASGGEISWDGRVAGILQPSGTYVWWIQVTDYTGKTFLRRGQVVLIR